MKKILLTFADSRMERALKRIHRQGEDMKLYDFIIAANESNLDISFREKYKKVLVPGVRGYGYWTWKAQLILQTLHQMEEGDLLHYVDAGCHLNFNGRQRLIEYFNLVENSEVGVLGFQAIPPDFHNHEIKLPDLSERKWCKGDLCDFFDVRDNSSVMDTQTIGAGVIFIRKCSASVKFIEAWLRVYASGTVLIDDTPSVSENPRGFIEHRHDQSIFSILGKLNKISIVSAYEYWYPSKRINLLPDWSILKNYPIHVKRDKGVHWFKKPFALLIRVYRRIRFEIKRKN